jgi:hypothetical protein
MSGKVVLVLSIALAGCYSSGGSGGSGGQLGTHTCTQESDCNSWYCTCTDGSVVNTSLCQNHACATSSVVCPNACAVFNHGKWSGMASGGGYASGGDRSSGPDAGACGGSGAACTQSAQCCNGLTCVEGRCATACGGLHASCTSQACCAGYECGGATCCRGFSQSCEVDTDCCEGLLCTSGSCN